MNSQRKDFVKGYGLVLKWTGFGLSIFFMLVAIQTYVNYTAIIEQTGFVEQQTQKVKDEISYFNNFQLKFLNSEWSSKILAHENGVFLYNEAPIVFKREEIVDAQALLPTQREIPTPWQEWKTFFSDRLNNQE